MRNTARLWAAGIGVALLLAVTGQGRLVSAAPTTGDTPWLGIYLQDLTPALREGLDYQGEGVLVRRVIPDSPADRAGLRQGDVVVRINSRAISSQDQLTRLVQASRVGQLVSIHIDRHGSRQTLSARLTARPDDQDLQRDQETPRIERGNEDETPPPDPDQNPEERDHSNHGDADREHGEHQERDSHRAPRLNLNGDDFNFELPENGMTMMRMGRGRLGIRIESLNSELGEYFDVRDGKGVLVVEVLKDTPAERAGLKAGDVIIGVGDQDVNDSDDLVRVLGSEEGKVSLGVVRHGTRRTVEAELDKADRRVMRIRPGEGMMGLRDGLPRRGSVEAPDRDQMRRELKELREELRDLKKELQDMKRE